MNITLGSATIEVVGYHSDVDPVWDHEKITQNTV